ncbi:MAG: HAMP domain-containing sensor histidine kinase [Phycisphaerae bacterium]|nr:HAMP domain-containing sensor histidine kinase [Phycisphaerae bacterium]
MTQNTSNISAQRIKLSVYESDCLSAHPLCAVKCAEYLSAGSYDNASLCLASDPAVALAVINLCKQKNISINFKNLDFAVLLKQLSKADLLGTILTLKVYDIQDSDILSLTNVFIRRSSIRTFAAKLIAEKTGLAGTGEAFAAALFADAGLLALAQLFTKSLLMLWQESKERKISLLSLEKEHLGITDNVLSRLLLQKWQFGDSIADTAWLYKTPANALTDKLPYGKIISIVRLADMLCDLDYQSAGECLTADDFQNLLQRLSLADSDINEIREKTQIFAGQINETLGLENENPRQFYSETIKQIYLNQLTAQPYAEDGFTAFVRKFINYINQPMQIVDIASVSAKIIAEIFSAEDVCVFAALPQQTNPAIVMAGLTTTLIEVPEGASIDNPQPWLCKQAGVEFDNEKTSFIPIEIAEQTTGGIIFTGSLSDNGFGRLTINKQLGQIADFIAKIFSFVYRNEYEESIVQLAIDNIGQPQLQVPAIQQAPSTNALAEIAAELAGGAAHELNNPLAVISGRAQLLSQSETDETKKLILNQISEKAKEAHEIVGQLMNYARPAPPQIRTVSPFIVINNALEKVNARYLSEPLDIHLENIESLSDVEIDAEQVAEAIAQIIYNALESYESGNGPVQIAGKEQSGLVEIRIKDSGCGMSNETLEKAAQPFFSDKPAGRQRGMGLSLADSFLKNNGCTVKIESQPEKGTTVTINLPKANKSENS